MKRSLDSSDSLGALMSMCPNTEEGSPQNTHVYSREFQSMLDGLDEEGCVEEGGQISEKKRRLSVEQVKALEKNFEVENKLEPERKVKLAQELGLQPRQVAVWFQNRRARWKTKQLERDYGHLKASYEALKLSYDTLQHDNESLHMEIRELKSKLKEEKTESNLSVKEEILGSEADTNKAADQTQTPVTADETTLNFENLNHHHHHNGGGGGGGSSSGGGGVLVFTDFKDGSSDSDSSAILNDDNNNSNSPNAAISSPEVVETTTMTTATAAATTQMLRFSGNSSSSSTSAWTVKAYQPQFVKMEEHNFFSSEEPCNFFSDDQAPSLHWYCPDQWN